MTTPIYEDGDALMEACEAVGAEGMVAKSRHSLWRAQIRTAQWVKFKTPSWLRMHSHRRLPATAQRRRHLVGAEASYLSVGATLLNPNR